MRFNYTKIYIPIMKTIKNLHYRKTKQNDHLEMLK